ncbi:MAG: hypothetical protein ACRDO2_14635, partial [Nocardioidaceae bacterium]
VAATARDTSTTSFSSTGQVSQLTPTADTTADSYNRQLQPTLVTDTDSRRPQVLNLPGLP